MNLIFGSGIIGYLAKFVLGWQVIPFKRSRYFTFEVPWSDNFLIYNELVKETLGNLIIDQVKVICKRPFSFKGQLLYDNQFAFDLYVQKVYNERDLIAPEMLKTTFTTFQPTPKQLHDSLYRKYRDDINENIRNFGEVASIDIINHIVKFKTGKSVEYDNIVSTIPLDALCELCDIRMNLEGRAVTFYHLESDSINLEGADQTLVSDLDIDFFKVQKVSGIGYVFWTYEVFDNPYQYFGNFLGYNTNMVEAKRIENVIPVGNPPDLSVFNNNRIFCVGSNAQWDDFMDVNSCVCRILKLTRN